VARVRLQLDLKHSRDILAGQRNGWRKSPAAHQRKQPASCIWPNSAGFGIWEMDHLTWRLDLSEALCALFDMPDGVDSLAEFMALVHPEDRSLVERAIASLQSARDVVRVEYRARHPGGDWLWLECVGKTIRRDDSGKALLSMGTMSDVTLRKTAEADRQLASIVFQGINDGICITDPQANILLVNEAFSRVPLRGWRCPGESQPAAPASIARISTAKCGRKSGVTAIGKGKSTIAARMVPWSPNG
jgi:PAS domain S-box-containing protein